MAHNHLHAHETSHEQNTTKNIGVAFWLNAIFVVIELVGGLITNSIAILSDALHDFGDCLSLAVAWAFQKKATKKRDNRYSYGYKRFSLLGSVFLSGVLTFSSIFVIIEAIKRLANPQEVSAQGMLWLAIVGVIINGSAALKLKKGSSLNEKAVYLHIMEDVLGWVAVLVVSIVMMFVDLPILDPILSLGISVWVLFNVFGNIKSTFTIFMQAIPDGLNVEDLQQQLLEIKGIDSIHDLHIWTLDGESHVMTLHVVTSQTDSNTLKKQIIETAKKFDVEHVTIEIEPSDTKCLHNCDSGMVDGI